MTPYIRQLRPHHWTKNLILFAGVIFAEQLDDMGLLLRSLAAFAVFCAVSSAVYGINDISDVEKDRKHPEKRHRPLPAGQVTVPGVAVMSMLLLAAGLAGGWALAPSFAVVVGIYFAMNLVYSMWLKHVAVLDLMVLASGFVLRAVGSVEALGRPDIAISAWLILCTFFLALFIGAGKRRAELSLLEAQASEHRQALSGYSLVFLDRILGTTTTAAVIGYAIYTLAPETQAKFGTHRLVYTVPFVVYGLFRYTYLVYERRAGGNPTEAILSDPPLLVNVLVWVAAVYVIIYVA